MCEHLNVPEKIPTQRLILRRAHISDADSIFREYAQDEDVARYMTWRPHSSAIETEEFLRGCIDRWNNGTEYSWSITLAGDDRTVGMISVRMHGHVAEIGYVLTRRLRNTGLMTEAMAALVTWLRQQPGIYRISAFCDVDNPASARVMEKSGLTREGIFRRWVVHPNISAEPRDCFVYAKICDRPQTQSLSTVI
jgi:ribosomal-protein-alanine N-acetyltransferase